MGTDVNTAQRLTKNHVVEETGCEAYARFTRAALLEAKEQVGLVYARLRGRTV